MKHEPKREMKEEAGKEKDNELGVCWEDGDAGTGFTSSILCVFIAQIKR